MTTIVKYPVDYSGVNSNNLVIGEVRDFAGLNKKLIAPHYGAFYETGLVIRDFFTNAILVPRIDYIVAQLDPTATTRSGLSVYQFILVLNPDTTKVSLQYQVVGGEYSLSVDAIAEFVALLENDTRAVQWGMIIGTPSEFPPTPHMHDANQIYGMDNVTAALEELRVAVLTGDAGTQQDLINYVLNQLNTVKETQFATAVESINGTLTNKAVSPYTLTVALQAMLSAHSNSQAEWEYNVGPENDSWGYIRNRQNGFCMAWGTSIALAPESVYQVNFRRYFNNIPLIIPGDISSTADSGSTGSQWVEVTAKIPEHTVSRTGFIAIGKRLSGSSTDFAKLKYIAIGISDDTQPVNFTEGNSTTVPPLSTQTLQPVWSGYNFAVTIPGAVDATTHVGIVFPATVPGGGYTVVTAAQTPASNFFYTPFPSDFVDSDYEIMGTAVLEDPDSTPNMNYVGVPLNVWHDLSDLKSNAGNTTAAGFVWEAVGLYGATYKLTVTIRHKTQPSKVASHVFSITQSSNAYSPQTMVGTSANVDLSTNLTYYTSADILSPLSISFAKDINIGGFKNSFAINRSLLGTFDTPTKYGYYGPTGSSVLVDDQANMYEVMVATPNYEGFLITDSDLPFDDWIGLDTLRAPANASQDWLIELTGSNVVLDASIFIHVRHKLDRKLHGIFRVGVNKIGDSTQPAWFGSGTLTSAPLVSTNKTFSFNIAMASPAGMCAVSLIAGGHLVSESLTYTHQLDYWIEGNYNVTATIISTVTGSGGGTFTRTGAPVGVAQLTNGTVFSWVGVNPTDVAMSMVVELRIAHRTQPDTYAVKQITFNINGYVP